MTLHAEPSPLAGTTIQVDMRQPSGKPSESVEYRVEDWWDRLGQGSWMWAQGNPACLNYAIRTGLADELVPLDDEVLYGKIGGFGHLIHVSEIATKETSNV